MSREAGRQGREAKHRVIIAAAIGVSWVVLLVLMIREFGTLPTAAELADDRPVRPPLPGDLVVHSVLSLAEALFAIGALWPWWRRRYALRALLASLVLAVWFVFSATMDINRMELLHRRWLALLVVVCLVIGLTALTVRALDRFRRPAQPRG